MDGLLDTLSVPYVIPHEGIFTLGVGLLIAGLLWFRFSLARRRGDRDGRDS